MAAAVVEASPSRPAAAVHSGAWVACQAVADEDKARLVASPSKFRLHYAHPLMTGHSSGVPISEQDATPRVTTCIFRFVSICTLRHIVQDSYSALDTLEAQASGDRLRFLTALHWH